VRRGERWALLGHNGAGKTTLLSLILGDNPQAYANDIELFGRQRGSGESIWDIKRRIGWMAPELHRHYPALMRCFDVVCSGWFDSVGLYRKCTPTQNDACRAVMEDLKISKLAQQSMKTISETEQRLVLLARALVKHPQLLVLDEPCQGLDAHNREFVYQTLDNSTHWAQSLILVTHQTHHLPKSITHSLILDKGQVAAQNV
jgi:molybdate transport system ATP-binding protein